MPLLIDLLWLVAGLLALYFGAEWLVNGASALARRYGISSLVVGLTVVAFGTSAPEFFVSVGFNARGFPEMALGNVIGSNICNIGLVLGVSAFICVLKVNASLLRRDLPILLLSTLLFSAMLWNGVISQGEGVVLFSGILIYTAFQLILAKKERSQLPAVESSDTIDLASVSTTVVWKLVFAILSGLVALYFGAQWLEKGGVSLARGFGVPEAVISLTLIAFSTSVPELATSMVASFKKEGDIIIGNVIGSCIFNLLGVIGATAMMGPIVTSQIEMVDLGVMGAMTALLIPVLARRRRVSRGEGAILLACYFGYTIYLWYSRVPA